MGELREICEELGMKSSPRQTEWRTHTYVFKSIISDFVMPEESPEKVAQRQARNMEEARVAAAAEREECVALLMKAYRLTPEEAAARYEQDKRNRETPGLPWHPLGWLFGG